jgi:hypothetical protein
MKTKQIHFDDGEVQADLTIARATYGVELDHMAAVNTALKETSHNHDNGKTPDQREMAERNAQCFIFPALVCGTPEVTLTRTVAEVATPLPLTFEVLLTLPADLIEDWLETVYELNPRWNPLYVDDREEREKKAPTSTDA